VTNTTVDTELNLPAIPDFNTVADEPQVKPWEDGAYNAVIVSERTITTREGNEITFTTEDTVSQKGDSRNINLQLLLTRQSDGRKFGTNYRINYRPDVDFSPERVSRITEINKSGGEIAPTSDEVRSRIALGQLKRLQKVAGTTFQRNGTGGLDLTPAFNKPLVVTLGDGDPNPTTGKVYKEVKRISNEAPKKGVL